jgi:hypothetical protein
MLTTEQHGSHELQSHTKFDTLRDEKYVVMQGVHESLDGDKHDGSDQEIEDDTSMCERSLCGSSICDDPTEKNTKCHHTDLQDTMDEDDNLSVCDVATRPKKKTKRATALRNHCYLCFFAEEEVCAHYQRFIVNEITRCSKSQIAQQVAADIHSRETLAGRPIPSGSSVADIKKHIGQHMMQACVKLPELCRELDDTRRMLQASLKGSDPETGEKVIDKQNVTLYLKTVRELAQVYKMGDPSKLCMGFTSSAASQVALNTDL